MTIRSRGVALTATLAAVLGLTSLTPAAVAAVPETVSAVDFEDGTTGDWTQSGDVTLTVIDDAGNNVLEVGGRSADYEGIESPAGIYEPGATYEFSMRAKLADDAPGDASIRFVMKPAYTWIGNTAINATDWTTVSGTFEVPADATQSELQAYLGTSDILVDPDGDGPEEPAPVDYTYLVDDIEIVRTVDPPACEPEEVVVETIDFEDSTTGSWLQNGDATLGFSAGGTDTLVLDVTGRVNNYDGLQSPVGAYDEGTQYNVSFDIKLAEASALRMIANEPGASNEYVWIGNQDVAADAWTTISGSHTFGAGAGDAKFYIEVAELTDYQVDNLVISALEGCDDPGPVGPPPGTVLLSTDFEDGLDGWEARTAVDPPATVGVATDYAQSGTQSAGVTERGHQGNGIGIDVSDILTPGGQVHLTAWVRFGDGLPGDAIWLSMQRVNGGESSFDTISQITGVTNSGWTPVDVTFTVGGFDTAFLYFETPYEDGEAGNTSDFYVDNVLAVVPEPAVIQDLPPIYENVPFPMGVAIDSRETTGSPADLLLRHFNQVTPENHMKPEAWYTDDGTFSPHPDADAVMQFAQDNDLRVYGHVLVWHSQTPPWFFQDDAGDPLTNSDADQAILRERMRTHIFAIAEYLSDEYGLFGSDTNPLVAWDVVNEVISDSSDTPGGMRESEWFRILGEEFVDDAFEYAEEAFNDVYADPSADRPVALFINDYNTEQSGKRARYLALIDRLVTRGAPIDGVGHQFHLNLAFPVENVEAAMADTKAAFPDLMQAVTEFDVPTGTPESEAKFIDQGYYYEDAFNIFRDYADDLFAVTVWGLYDARSWRDDQGGPLVFDDGLQAKPAYDGIVGGDLPAPLRAANSFMGSVPVDGDATESDIWDRLPLLPVGDSGDFQTRWETDHLTVFVSADDPTDDAGDAVQLLLGDETYTVARDGSGFADAVVTERDGGYDVVAHLPLTDAAEGDLLEFDARVVTDGASDGWNAEGVLGTLTLVEELSFVEVVEADEVPVIDAAIDDVWADANAVTTDKQVSGADGAIGTFSTLWKDNTLYVLAEVADPVIDTSGTDPWTQDSVEIYVDAGNVKNGSYRYDDTQIRISADGVVSFGTGDETFQSNRLEWATAEVEGGYVIEAAISLLEYGGAGTFHGLDFQVNDATDGSRDSIRNWADPTGLGYQSTARWGVGELIAADEPPAQCGKGHGKPCYPAPCFWDDKPGKGKGHGWGKPCWWHPWTPPGHGHGHGHGAWWKYGSFVVAHHAWKSWKNQSWSQWYAWGGHGHHHHGNHGKFWR